ncbi:hypothetical protein Cva_00303 [Caedimonas varicaedens]|uniref:Primase C-terminal 2 domain-containing protein n=1 Tax=Caedimonas varicaedens TaxID=1629334 RepID=A0A0K8MB32_9PROT|nr:hypothetical protein Cva_00303 [Caedimonas varicaedens]
MSPTPVDHLTIRFSLFKGGVQDVHPVLQTFTLQQMADFITPHDVPELQKEERQTLFSMVVFQPNTTRKKENVATMTGVVFDFDNKDAFIPIEEVLDRLNEKHILYYWYTTWSHTPERPRWRLILPFANELVIGLWGKIYEEAVFLIGNPPGIDHGASKDAARLWFTPCKQPGGVFMAQACREGRLINPYDLPSLLSPVEQEDMKRQQGRSRPQKREENPDNAVASSSFSLQQTKQALRYIDANCDYDHWLKVAMALHQHFKGSEEAFKLWKKWSSKSDKYPGEIILDRHWNSFGDKEEAVAIGTLIHLAKQGGYQSRALSEGMPLLASKDDQDVSEESVEIDEEEVAFDFSDYDHVDIYDFPNDLLRETYAYLLKCNSCEIPSYALGATLSLTGFLLRDSLQGLTGLRTNFMALVIGASGTGKTLTLNGVLEILDYVKQTSFYTGRLGSVQGCITHLEKNGGCLFLVQDEAIYELKSIRNKMAGNAEMRTEEFKMRVFSCPPSYTSDTTKHSEPIIIYRPFFSEFSVSTPDMLKHFSPGDITKGLLPRYLLLTTDQLFFKKKHYQRSDMSSALKGVLDEFKVQRKSRTVAVFNNEAHAYFQQFEQWVQRQRHQAFQKSESLFCARFDSLLARLPEHATKLALLGASKGMANYEMTLKSVAWGIAVALLSFKNIVNVVQTSIYENQCEEYRDRVLRIVHSFSKGEWVRKREILRKIRFLKVRDLDDILFRLQDEERIEIKPAPKNSLFIRSIMKGDKKNDANKS